MNDKKRFLVKTIKMTLAGVISIFIGNLLGLKNVLTTGIVGLITITDTREASFRLVITRFFSTLLAFLIATIFFRAMGFNLLAFGIFLIVYIPLANLFNLNPGVSNSIVLVTHFMIAESVSLQWQINGFLIMFVGVITALVINYFSPSYLNEMKLLVSKIEKRFINIISEMEEKLNDKAIYKDLSGDLSQLKKDIKELNSLAIYEHENKRSFADYYISYSNMRDAQRRTLEIILTLIEQLSLDIKESEILSSIFEETKNTFDESNDVLDLINKINDLYRYFRESDLPKTREEFEDRARLFTILSYFESFLKIKRDFYLKQ